MRREGEYLRARADDRAPAQVMVAGREHARGLPSLAVGQPDITQPVSHLGSKASAP